MEALIFSLLSIEEPVHFPFALMCTAASELRRTLAVRYAINHGTAVDAFAALLMHETTRSFSQITLFGVTNANLV